MSRIGLHMNMAEVVSVMSDGNQGAIAAMMSIMRDDPKIDPQAMMTGLGPILMMDTLEIYGSRIWMFYKDVCGEETTNVVAALRAYQLGQLAGVTEYALNHAIDNYGEGIDCDEIVAAVMGRLKEFNDLRTKTSQEVSD